METNNQKELQPSNALEMNKDMLEESLIAAGLMKELHKGPDIVDSTENDFPGRLEKDGEAMSANDSGE